MATINLINFLIVYYIFILLPPGGLVVNGLQIIDQLKSIKERHIELICIADFATDSIIVVKCDPELVEQNDEIKKANILVDINIVFSKCSLSRVPIDVIIKTKIDSDDNKATINESLSRIIPSQFIITPLLPHYYII